MALLRAFAACLSASLCIAIAGPASSGFAADAAPTITAENLAKKTQTASKPFLLDVRTPQEFADGHIPGAVNIPLAELDKRMSEVKSGAPREVVVYCMHGQRSLKGQEELTAAGFPSVLHLEGGMSAWVSAGKPVEKAKSTK